MPGRDHFTDVNGDCMPGCRECLIARLEAEVKRLRSVIMLKDARISALEGRRVAMRAVEDPQSCSFYQVAGTGSGEP